MKDSDLLMDPEYMLFVDVIHREHQRGMDVFKYLSYLLVSLYAISSNRLRISTKERFTW